MNRVEFRCLSSEDKLKLEEPFVRKNIKSSIQDNEGNKIPKPSGFNFKYIKRTMKTREPDIVEFVNEFHINAKLPKAITSLFLNVILKNKNPRSLNEYRKHQLTYFFVLV